MERPALSRNSQAEAARLLARAAETLEAGNPGEAILTLQAALHITPDNAPILHDVGFLCLQAGRRPEAIAALRRALAIDPLFAQASLCLGIALQDEGDTGGALAAYRHAVSLQPALAIAHVCLGALLEALGERGAAIAAFQAGAAGAPTSIWGRLAGARALLADDRDREAESLLNQLLALSPGNAMAQDLLATVCANTGRFPEARRYYECATAAAPQLAGSYYDLVRCRPITRDDAALIDRMQAALGQPSLAVDARVKVHLALGKAFDDLGDGKSAMQHYDAADTLRNRLVRFDAAAFNLRVDRLIAHCSRERIARGVDSGCGDGALVIMGLPRSGTTLVEQILSSHSQVHGAGELDYWTQRGAEWEAAALAEDAIYLARLGAEYSNQLRALAPQALRVADKMPLNVLWAGLIHLSAPRATLIFCRRSLIDTALSIHRTYFNPRTAFPTGGPALVTLCRAVERLRAHWRAVLPSDRFVEVEYEQLVLHPEREIRRVIDACRLPWEDACLRPELNPRTIKTPSKWQARQPVNRSAVDSWRRYAPWLNELATLAPLCPLTF